MERYFDRVFIDTNSGDNEFSMRLIDECDAIVVSLRQNRYLLDTFFDNNPLKGKKVFYVFSDYDTDSKYNLHNIRVMHREISKENSAVIPHSPEFMDAISDERIMRFFALNIDAVPEAKSSYFFSSMIKAVATFENFIVSKNFVKEQEGTDDI